MKKLFSNLIALVLGLVLSFSVFACKSQVEEPKPEPVVAVDGINVQDVIGALGPINDAEYLTVNVEFGMQTSVAEGSAFEAEIQLKKTNRGYDFIATIVPEMVGIQRDVAYPSMTVVCYYIDGRMVLVSEMAGQIVDAVENEDSKTFNGLLNDLNKEIAENAEMRQTYEEILALSQEIKALFSQGAMANLDESLDVDAKTHVNDAFTYLKTNSQKTLYELIISEAEITQTEQEIEEIVLGVVEQLCGDNPTLMEFVDRVVTVINEELDAENQIDLHEICDGIESEGLNVFALCEIVNQLAGEEVLLPPETAISLYDYLSAMLSSVRVDDIAKLMMEDQNATMAELAETVLLAVKSVTLADVVQELVGVDLSTFAISFEDLRAAASLRTDSSSRIVSLSAEYAVGFSMMDGCEVVEEFMSAILSVEISYDRFDTEMAIPQEVLDMLEETSLKNVTKQ